MTKLCLKNQKQKKGRFSVANDTNGVLKYINMDLLRLSCGEEISIGQDGYEFGLVLNSGSFEYSYNDNKTAVEGRKDQFSGLPHALYIPSGKKVKVRATSEMQGAIYFVKSNKRDTDVKLIKPEDIKILDIGKGSWQIQGFFIVGENVNAERLIVGETWVPEGNWSSCPPHSHDKDNPGVESELEEIYYFRFNPSQGFGFQAVYDDDLTIDEAYRICDEDAVMIPRGYHPNVTGPGYEMRMQWGMAGPKRSWLTKEDPAHSWIAESAKGGVREHNF